MDSAINYFLSSSSTRLWSAQPLLATSCCPAAPSSPLLVPTAALKAFAEGRAGFLVMAGCGHLLPAITGARAERPLPRLGSKGSYISSLICLQPKAVNLWPCHSPGVPMTSQGQLSHSFDTRRTVRPDEWPTSLAKSSSGSSMSLAVGRR